MSGECELSQASEAERLSSIVGLMQPVFSITRKLEGGLLGLFLLYSLTMGACMPVAVEPARILERAPIVAGLLGYMASGAYRCANFFAALDSRGSSLSSAFLAATVAVS